MTNWRVHYLSATNNWSSSLSGARRRQQAVRRCALSRVTTFSSPSRAPMVAPVMGPIVAEWHFRGARCTPMGANVDWAHWHWGARRVVTGERGPNCRCPRTWRQLFCGRRRWSDFGWPDWPLVGGGATTRLALHLDPCASCGRRYVRAQFCYTGTRANLGSRRRYAPTTPAVCLAVGVRILVYPNELVRPQTLWAQSVPVRPPTRAPIAREIFARHAGANQSNSPTQARNIANGWRASSEPGAGSPERRAENRIDIRERPRLD